MVHRSVRASRQERTRRLPGDELIPKPIASLTHATTILRPPTDVWPWLAQMGAGTRAGWYSYDFIDNGCHASADCIMPSLQALSVGVLFPRHQVPLTVSTSFASRNIGTSFSAGGPRPMPRRS